MKKLSLIGLFTTCLLYAQDTLVMPITGNGGFYNTCYGIIYDNGLDSDYHDHSHATITIAPLWAQNVSLYFEEFNLEFYFDSLTLYDGPGTSFTKIGTYTGNDLLGQTITSTGNAITIGLWTDDIQTGTGFKAWVSCIMGNEEETTNQWRIYPNPAGSFLWIETQYPAQVKSMSIMDVAGRMMMCGGGTTCLDIESLPIGTYFLMMEFNNGRVACKKWMKE